MVRNGSDQFGKNILRDLLCLRGRAQTEEEVPPTDAVRIDLWFVPDTIERQGAHQVSGVLAKIAQAAAVIEIWSDAINEREFHDCLYKRHAWLRALEMRDKRDWPILELWHVCAGKPETVVERFGFQRADGFPGYYFLPAGGWRVHVVVVRELPKTRETILLRLLGRGSVRQQAIRELRSLPEDAWEKQLATPWLLRLDLLAEAPRWASLSDDEKEFVMDIQAWYKEHVRGMKAEFRRELEHELRQQLEPQLRQQLEPQLRQQLEPELKLEGEVESLAHLFERRLSRRLSTTERDSLATRVRLLGPERVGDVVLDSSFDALASWLENPDSR